MTLLFKNFAFLHSVNKAVKSVDEAIQEGTTSINASLAEITGTADTVLEAKDIVEAFSMAFDKSKNGTALKMAWDNVQVALPIEILD